MSLWIHVKVEKPRSEEQPIPQVPLDGNGRTSIRSCNAVCREEDRRNLGMKVILRWRICFERAGGSFLEKLAKASGESGLRAAGVHMLGSNTKVARVALVEAAEIYESVGQVDFSAKCFMDFKDFKRAGDLSDG